MASLTQPSPNFPPQSGKCPAAHTPMSHKSIVMDLYTHSSAFLCTAQGQRQYPSPPLTHHVFPSTLSETEADSRDSYWLHGRWTVIKAELVPGPSPTTKLEYKKCTVEINSLHRALMSFVESWLILWIWKPIYTKYIPGWTSPFRKFKNVTNSKTFYWVFTWCNWKFLHLTSCDAVVPVKFLWACKWLLASYVYKRNIRHINEYCV